MCGLPIKTLIKTCNDQHEIKLEKSGNPNFQPNTRKTNLGHKFQAQQVMQNNNQRSSSTCLASLHSISLMPVVKPGTMA
jgi:hypothetical protein